MGRKHCEKRGKGEIACYEKFLIFSQCFQKTSTSDMLKPGLVWGRVKHYGYFFQTQFEPIAQSLE